MKRMYAALIALVGVIALIASSGAYDLNNEYRMAVADYFDVSYDLMSDLVDLGIDNEDLAVVLFAADRAKADVMEIARERVAGKSWSVLSSEFGLGAGSYYLIVSGKISSKTFAPIFNKFKETDPQKWNTISFTDADIVNLVNLRFISSHYDYSVFDVMAMRDYGKTFARINNQVKSVKEAQYKKEMVQADH